MKEFTSYDIESTSAERDQRMSPRNMHSSLSRVVTICVTGMTPSLCSGQRFRADQPLILLRPLNPPKFENSVDRAFAAFRVHDVRSCQIL
jgi:hypothetical protein